MALALVAGFDLLKVQDIASFTVLGATPLTTHFVPYLWGSCLMALSFWLIIRGTIRYRRLMAEEGAKERTSLTQALKDKREVIASFFVLALYVSLMSSVGFIIMTAIYVFLQVLILTPVEKWKKNIIPAAITGVVSGSLLYYIFANVLNVLLPAGILKI